MGRHGENIRKRKDGRWEARVLSGYDVNGKAKYRSLYGKTYLEVKNKKKEYISNLENSNQVFDNTLKIRIRDLFILWIVERESEIKASTCEQYRTLAEKHILPVLGEHYLSGLSTETVNNYLKEKLNGSDALAAKTVLDIRSLLVQMFAYASVHHYVSGVTGKLWVPKKKKTEIEILSASEQKKLMDVIRSDDSPYRLAVLLSLYTGLRIGEVCALQWKDIDPEDGSITVSKTLLRIRDRSASEQKTKIIITAPKTENSRRTIPLPVFLTDILRHEAKEEEYYVVTGKYKYMEPRVCLERFKTLCRRAGIKEHTFHCLRHTFATRCVEMGFDAKSLSEILGHSSVTITLERYVHPTMEQKRIQMQRLSMFDD